MNDDLIKRSDAIEAIEVVDWYHQNHNKDMVHGANSNIHQAWYKSQDIYEALENVPSANRPQGKWKRMKFTDCGSPIDKCSICGYYINGDMEVRKFCPNCGAKMKGANDDR